MAKTMHLMTQDNQPYGSVRKCCEICGLGMVGRDDDFWKQHTWADTAENYHTNWAEPLTLCSITMKIPDQLKELAHQWVDGSAIQRLAHPVRLARVLAGEPPSKVDPVWLDDPEPKWLPTEYYRVKPRPATLDWSHVKKGWNFCARARNGTVNLYTHEPKPSTINDAWCLVGIGDIADATLFASYDPGDTEWNTSLIKRPEEE